MLPCHWARARHSDWTGQCPSHLQEDATLRNRSCKGHTSRLLSPWHLHFSGSRGERVLFEHRLQGLHLLPVVLPLFGSCVLKLPPPSPFTQRNSNFFEVFICCSQEHQFVSQSSLLGESLSFKVPFSNPCDAVGLFAPFVCPQALQQNWTHGFQSLTWYVISYFILLSAWGSLSGLVFFSIIAFINWPLMAA